MLNQAHHLSHKPRLWPLSKDDTDESSVMEASFRQHYLERMLPFIRAGLGLGIALVIIVCIIDMLLMPKAFFEPVVPLRLVTMLLPLVIGMGAAVFLQKRNSLPYLLAGVAMAVGVAAIWIGTMTAGNASTAASWPLVYVTFSAYLVLGLTFRQSVAVGWSLFVLFVAIGVVQGVELQQLAYGVLFLAACNLVGSWGAYVLERNARELFDDKRELVRLAHTDGLTGLFNRRTFDQHLRHVWKQAQREGKHIAVIVADIDHFKLYNDCYGHRMGDDCIKAVADVLAARVSRPLDMVARYGGEEYVILLYDANPDFLQSYVQGLCQDVADLKVEHKASETLHCVSLSIGAASTDASSNVAADQLIRQADDALYEAKSQGRNRAIVYRTEWGQQTTANLAATLI
ncbi:MAG: GGDEF domain-containing protein [Gammaproteobacteria bacterium]|nr:GGDEF domain-containing protein [Gammaproteobacteria bacterium]